MGSTPEAPAPTIEDEEYFSEIGAKNQGTEYQLNFGLLFFARMWISGDISRLAYEMKKADKLDDLVLYDDKGEEIHFFQVKRGEVTNDKAKLFDLEALFSEAGKGDFDLCKYLKSYLNVIHNFRNIGYKKSCYILTNKILRLGDRENNLVKTIELEENILLQCFGSTARHFKLDVLDAGMEKLKNMVNKDFNLLKTDLEKLFESGKVSPILQKYSLPLREVLSIDDGKICQFSESFHSKNMEFSVAKLFNVLQSDRDKKKRVDENFLSNKPTLKFLPPYVTDEEIRAFFADFTLSVGLPHDLRPTIDSYLRTWLKTWASPDQVGKLGKPEMDQIFINLEKTFHECIKSPNNMGTMKRFLFQSDKEKCFEKIQNDKLLESMKVKKHLNYYVNRNIKYTDDGDLSNTFQNLQINYAKFDVEHLAKHHQHIVLVASPGMGKSSVLQFLAFEMQKEHKFDVFPVYFSETLEKELEKIETVSSLDSVLSILKAALSEENCDAIKNSDSSMILVLDGFDEISPKYTNRVNEMLKQISCNANILMIISSRKKGNILSSISFDSKRVTLEPYSEEDKASFFKKVWKVTVEKQNLFESYSKHILDEFHSRIDEQLHDLPPMIKSLADICSDTFEKLIEKDKIDKLRIAQLYKQFVKNCYRGILEEKYRYNSSRDAIINDIMNGVNVFLMHEYLAMKQLGIEIPKGLFKNESFKNPHDKFRSHYKNKTEKSFLFEIENDNVHFFHPSYCHFLVALYICEGINSLKKSQVVRVWSEHSTIREWSMMILGENCPDKLKKLRGKEWTIAMRACENGNFSKVLTLKELFKEFSFEHLYEMLQVSAEKGHSDIFYFILNDNENFHKSYVFQTAVKNNHDKVLMLLQPNKMDVDVNSHGQGCSVESQSCGTDSSDVQIIDLDSDSDSDSESDSETQTPTPV